MKTITFFLFVTLSLNTVIYSKSLKSIAYAQSINLNQHSGFYLCDKREQQPNTDSSKTIAYHICYDYPGGETIKYSMDGEFDFKQIRSYPKVSGIARGAVWNTGKSHFAFSVTMQPAIVTNSQIPLKPDHIEVLSTGYISTVAPRGMSHKSSITKIVPINLGSGWYTIYYHKGTVAYYILPSEEDYRKIIAKSSSNPRGETDRDKISKMNISGVPVFEESPANSDINNPPKPANPSEVNWGSTESLKDQGYDDKDCPLRNGGSLYSATIGRVLCGTLLFILGAATAAATWTTNTLFVPALSIQ